MIDDVKETLEDHEDRIQSLEKADISMGKSIENLIKSVDNLASWVKTFIIAAFGTLFTVACGAVAFIVWYIQKG